MDSHINVSIRKVAEIVIADRPNLICSRKLLKKALWEVLDNVTSPGYKIADHHCPQSHVPGIRAFESAMGSAMPTNVTLRVIDINIATWSCRYEIRSSSDNSTAS